MATTGVNTIGVDASALVGSLAINLLGDQAATNTVTLSTLGANGTAAIDGGTTSTQLNFGTGNLALIQGNVSVNSATLTVDDSTNSAPGIVTLTTTSLSGWSIPMGVAPPTLSFSQLEQDLTLLAGPDDQFDIEGTPAAVG